MTEFHESSALSQPPIDELFQAIDYRVARSKSELEAAFSLVYQEYLKRGYIKDSSIKLKCSIFNMLPKTVTFVAVLENTVLATATLIPDSPLGLPMEEIYHDEILEFRRAGMKLCEIGMLASDTELFGSDVSLMLNSKKMFLVFFLFKTVFDYARDVLGLDQICITINPKHSLIYDFLLFKDFGGLKSYQSVNGAPAIAKHLDLRAAAEECEEKNKEGLIKLFFHKRTDPEKFKGEVFLNPEDLKYFFMSKTDALKKCTSSQREYLQILYPGYGF